MLSFIHFLFSFVTFGIFMSRTANCLPPLFFRFISLLEHCLLSLLLFVIFVLSSSFLLHHLDFPSSSWCLFVFPFILFLCLVVFLRIRVQTPSPSLSHPPPPTVIYAPTSGSGMAEERMDKKTFFSFPLQILILYDATSGG